NIPEIERGFIGGSEVVDHAASSAQLHYGVRIINPTGIGVEFSIRGLYINITGRICRRAATGLPDRPLFISAGRVGRRPDELLTEGRRVVTHEPALISIVVPVRPKGYIQ